MYIVYSVLNQSFINQLFCLPFKLSQMQIACYWRVIKPCARNLLTAPVTSDPVNSDQKHPIADLDQIILWWRWWWKWWCERKEVDKKKQQEKAQRSKMLKYVSLQPQIRPNFNVLHVGTLHTHSSTWMHLMKFATVCSVDYILQFLSHLTHFNMRTFDQPLHWWHRQ